MSDGKKLDVDRLVWPPRSALYFGLGDTTRLCQETWREDNQLTFLPETSS